jgi:adenosylcobinamide-phosphate synthase
VAIELTNWLAGHPLALAPAVLLDLAIGDPVYRGHPVRLMGATLARVESGLRRVGADGSGGGIALFVILGAGWVVGVAVLIVAAARLAPWLSWLLHVFVLYSLLALGDLVHHVQRVERALSQNDLAQARAAVGALVGRDTERLDPAACRRAAIESLSESLTDGFTSALFWYVLAGVPGLVLFKVISTMDSMVGFKTPRYRQFGSCGARLDDIANYVPARLTWLLIALVAACWPGYSARKAFRVGLTQHAVLPGPNSGWSEAALAGAIGRRLVGPIWMNGALVTETWIGDPADPPAGSREDLGRATSLVMAIGLIAATVAALILVPVRA